MRHLTTAEAAFSITVEARKGIIEGLLLCAMSAHQLTEDLRNFYGTHNYHLFGAELVLTDGIKYLADTANAYWLLTAIKSHLADCFAISDFCVAKLSVENQTAHLVITDGNDHVLAHQQFDYTDFPIQSITIYVIKSHPYSVILLPSEY